MCLKERLDEKVLERMDVVRKMERQSGQKMEETPQSPWSSRTVEWQSSPLNAVTSGSKLYPFCCCCPFVP